MSRMRLDDLELYNRLRSAFADKSFDEYEAEAEEIRKRNKG